MAGQRVGTDWAGLLGALKGQVAQLAAFAAVPVHLAADETEPPPTLPARDFVLLGPGDLEWFQGDTTEPAMDELLVQGSVWAAVWSRRSLDLPGRADQLLAEATGVTALVEALVAGLFDYDPGGSGGNYLLDAPLRFLRARRPRQPSAALNSWTGFVTEWAVCFHWILPG